MEAVASFQSRFAALGVLGAALCTALLARQVAAQPDPAEGVEQLREQCVRRIRDVNATWVECQAKLGTDETGRHELQDRTAGLLQGALCSAPVRFQRKKLLNAMRTGADLSIGQHDVQCELETSGAQTFTVTLTFAPTVAFRGGSVSDVRLGLRSAEPLPDFLASALGDFLESDAVRGNLVRNLDAFLRKAFPDGPK